MMLLSGAEGKKPTTTVAKGFLVLGGSVLKMHTPLVECAMMRTVVHRVSGAFQEIPGEQQAACC